MLLANDKKSINEKYEKIDVENKKNMMKIVIFWKKIIILKKMNLRIHLRKR
jgi:hypothetical protein